MKTDNSTSFYQRLPQSPSSSDDNLEHFTIGHKRRPWTLILLVVSLIMNAILTTVLLHKTTTLAHMNQGTISAFAGLEKNVPKQWNGNHVASPEEWQEIWDRNSSYDAGIISLEDDYARKMSLPRSQRWPWNYSRGVYILNAYHNLHCAKRIRTSLDEFKAGREQTIPWAHVQHCLLTWRDEIFCEADDTPRYTGFQPASVSAYGQVRMCRDWNKLERWASDPRRAGCWKSLEGEEGVNGFHVLDRYRFCSDDNEYQQMAATKWTGNWTYDKEDERNMRM